MAEIKITTFDYTQDNYDNWDLPFDYHCVYILENGQDVYIGETKDVIQRSDEHKKVRDLCYQYSFSRIHILTGRTFEETPAKHFETLLIRLMRADGKFHVLNTKTEWQHYFRKNKFELCFDEVWLELEKLKLVKHKEFQDILNLSQYKFSPNMPLTKAQHDTLTSIIHTIDSQETRPHKEGFLPRPILIAGDPGSGKTVVATSLFYYLRTHEAYKDLKIGLVYASSTTRDEIQEVFKSVEGVHKKDVIAPITVTKGSYDIIICDELDWILTCSKYQILFYDAKQSVCPSDITNDSFEQRLYARNRGVRPITLKEQLRIRAGSEYVPYIYDILYHRVSMAKDFHGYEFKLFQSFDTMFQHMNAKEEMGSIYTIPGLNLNYTAVVIGPEVFYDPSDDCIKIDRSHLYDNKLKTNTTDDDLKRYILNTYAVS